MKISTKGRYGLRLMVDLAVNNDTAPTPLREIAERQNISEKYLEQIVLLLARAGLVRSVRGSLGGYSITKDPQEIFVGDILRVVEGSIVPVECVENRSVCERSGFCVTRLVWEQINTAVNGVVDSISIQNLAELAVRQSETV